jgi:hypothetical protein
MQYTALEGEEQMSKLKCVKVLFRDEAGEVQEGTIEYISEGRRKGGREIEESECINKLEEVGV